MVVPTGLSFAMVTPSIKTETDLIHNLKWLMFFRIIFTLLLLGSTIILQLDESPSPLEKSLMILYMLVVGIFILSFFYAIIINRIKQFQHQLFFAYLQIALDSLIVTLIIFVTGSYSSIFSFLYLVVIIYSSILLVKSGPMIVATFCSIQYGIMIGLDYFGMLEPFVADIKLSAVSYTWPQVSYKILITIFGCYAVALLCYLLSKQENRAIKELMAMEDKIKRVEKMAAVGEMAAGLAHEIKNPLASLAGSIQLITEDFDGNPDNERLMQIVLRETERLNELVGNFLLFARPPTGKMQIVKLDDALSDIISLFKTDLSTKPKIEIKKALHPDLWIEMDTGHLHQVLWNLLMNAAEAINDRGHIEVRMFPMSHNQVCIEITDNGCGMSRELIRSIFDPFFTTKAIGTGLGLSIVHSILDTYDGSLDVVSELDRGTTFSLKLKRVYPPS